MYLCITWGREVRRLMLYSPCCFSDFRHHLLWATFSQLWRPVGTSVAHEKQFDLVISVEYYLTYSPPEVWSIPKWGGEGQNHWWRLYLFFCLSFNQNILAAHGKTQIIWKGHEWKITIPALSLLSSCLCPINRTNHFRLWHFRLLWEFQIKCKM